MNKKACFKMSIKSIFSCESNSNLLFPIECVCDRRDLRKISLINLTFIVIKIIIIIKNLPSLLHLRNKAVRFPNAGIGFLQIPLIYDGEESRIKSYDLQQIYIF